MAEQMRASGTVVDANLGTAFKICSRHTGAYSSMRHGLRDRPGGAAGQRLQPAIRADAKPLRDRSCHDALAVAGGDEIITTRLQFARQR